MNIGKIQSTSMIFLLAFGFVQMNAQVTSLEQAYELLENNNGRIQIINKEIEKAKVLSEGTYLFPKAEIEGNLGQLNSFAFDQSYGISQSFNIYEQRASKSLGTAKSKILDNRIQSVLADGKYQVQLLWDKLQYLNAKSSQIDQHRTNWDAYVKLVRFRAQYGEEASTKVQLAEVQAQQIALEQVNIDVQATMVEESLKQLLRTQETIEPPLIAYKLITKPVSSDQPFESHPKVLEAKQQIELLKAQQQVNTAAKKPDFMLGYEIQSFNGEMDVNGNLRTFNSIPRFQVAKIGIAVPIFKKGYSAKDKLIEKEMAVNQEIAKNIENEMNYSNLKLIQETNVLLTKLEFIETKQLPILDDIIQKSELLYRSGETSSLDYLQALTLLTDIQMDYLETIHQHNQIVLKMNYLNQQ